MLVAGNKEPQSREETLGWLEQQMGACVDNMCRINIYSDYDDEGQIAGLSYMLVAGNKEPQSREETLGWLEQHMVP